MEPRYLLQVGALRSWRARVRTSYDVAPVKIRINEEAKSGGILVYEAAGWYGNKNVRTALSANGRTE